MVHGRYWHSKDSIASQQEALDTVAGFRSRGLPVDVLVLDYAYKACDGCTSFNRRTFPDPKGMVATLLANGTRVMAHVNIEQNFSMILGGEDFLRNGWVLHQTPPGGGAPTPLCRSDRNGQGHDSTTCRYDPSIPAARAALWKSINATLVANGAWVALPSLVCVCVCVFNGDRGSREKEAEGWYQLLLLFVPT